MTHTPGPWQANQSELEAHSALVEIRTAPNGDYKICDCGYQNARLIAAAPELLNVLKRLTEKLARANAIQHSGARLQAEDWSELYQLQNESAGIIAKAEGRG